MRPTSRDDFTIAIICALTLEADAVEELFDETYDRLGLIYEKQPGDDNAYINGRIGKHNVVLCYMPGMGKGSAASVASSLKISYTRIQVALIVGICGGAPYSASEEEIFLGDVIMSDSVIEYDFGRQYPGGFQRKTDVRDTLGRPNRKIRALFAGLKASRARREFQDQMLRYLHTMQQSEAKWCRPAVIDDILFEASYQHKHYGPGSSSRCLCFDDTSPDGICEEALEAICNSVGCNEKQIRRRRHNTDIMKAAIHIGTIASADTVMKSGERRDHLVKTERVIGFEMEGAGVWDNVPCIIIKGVCDYADSHKNKAWQAYAAATGASAAKAFLEYWRPVARKERQCHWMIPFQKNLRFVGREKEIAKLDGLISPHNGPSKIAICGLGGIGKTQIALELAYRIRERDSSWSIFWIPCTSQESVEQAYMSIAQTAGIQKVKPVEAKERVMAYLSQESSGKWLLIFDNADDQDMWMKDSETASALKKFLPQSPQGRILFTTRNRTLAVRLSSPHVITISELDEETGLKMLEKSLIHSDQSVDHSAAVILLNQLALLPLAITQAAAYINENGISLSTYVALLEKQESHVIELLSEDFEDDGRYEAIHNPIATTWWISFQQIRRLNILAADYLSFMACINPRDIPQSLLPQPASDNERIKAIGLLDAYSFISKQADGNLLSLHRLVHLATRNWLRKNGHFSSQVVKTAGHLDKKFPENDHTNRKQWREYLPHSLALIGEDEFQDKSERFIDLVWKVGSCLYKDGRYNEAEKLEVQVMETRKTVLGDKHPDTLISIANLAAIYWNQGRWSEAEKLEVQVMKIRETVLGDKHPITLISMANLAATYRNQGRWNDAEKLEVQVMETRKIVLGDKHPDTLTSISNLAVTYRNQGRWSEAEKLEVQVMEIRKILLGDKHPDTLTSISNLASIYRNQGRWSDAEKLEVQVMEIRKILLGDEHPNTLISMANLASTYRSQGRWNDAEKLDVQVIVTSKAVLGDEHPNTLISISNLASTYRNQGRWNDAEKLDVQVMETRKTVLGDEHPKTLISMANLASTYRNQGRWNDAEKLDVQVMVTSKAVLGDEHPDTLASMNNLAYTWQSQGKLHDALSLMKECSDLQKKVLGPNHPHSLSSSRALKNWMDEYNTLTDQIPLTGDKTPQPRQKVSAGSSAVVTTLLACEGHINLSYPQRRSAATLFINNHPLINAARTPSPAPEGQNLQDVD